MAGSPIVYYPGDASGGATFGARLDPDTGAAGMPYYWDFSDELGTATIASAAVTVADELTQVGTARIGTWSETTRQFTASTGNQTVEVVLTAGAAARNGRGYEVTVQATDSNGYDGHVCTMLVMVDDR